MIIYIKLLNGDLYEISDKDIKDDISYSSISDKLCSEYPEVFKKGGFKLEKNPDISNISNISNIFIINAFINPIKYVQLIKTCSRLNWSTKNEEIHFTLATDFLEGVNVTYFENLLDKKDIPVFSDFSKIYSLAFPPKKIYNTICIGSDPNRLNIIYDKAKKNYFVSFGNFGTVSRDCDLKNVLSSEFSQTVSYVTQKPHSYKLQFTIKPEMIDQIISIIRRESFYFLKPFSFPFSHTSFL